MTLNTIVDQLYSKFKDYASDVRVILLHPASRYRTALVSRLIADESVPVFYYAIGSDDIDIPSFIAGFTHDMAEQVPTFGTSINMVPLDDLRDLTPLLEAFSEDLDRLTPDPFILLLDEFAPAPISADFQSFLTAPAHIF